MDDPNALLPMVYTPGIAPTPITQTSYHGALPLWLHNLMVRIVGGPVAQEAMSPTAAPTPPADQTPAQARQQLGAMVSPSPGTQSQLDKVKSEVANQGIQALWDRASGLPVFQSSFWRNFGVYGILVALFLIGVVLLITGSRK